MANSRVPSKYDADGPSKKSGGVLKMSGQKLHEYASAKRKGLPGHAKKVTVGEMMERGWAIPVQTAAGVR